MKRKQLGGSTTYLEIGLKTGLTAPGGHTYFLEGTHLVDLM
jgi:hypothetical protein